MNTPAPSRSEHDAVISGRPPSAAATRKPTNQGLHGFRGLPHQETGAYAARRTSEGKSNRDIQRCLERAIAREINRQLQAHAKSQTASQTLLDRP